MSGVPAGSSRPLTRRDPGGPVALGVCLLLVAALSLGLQRVPPAPVTWVDAGVEQPAEGRRYDAEVRAVRVATAVRRADTADDPLTTAHRYVVADLTVRVKLTQVTFGRLTLETVDGRSYDPRTEFGRLESCQPGFTAFGSVVFEVPPERVAGAVLVLGPETGSYLVHDTALRFDLGLTPDTPVAALVELAAPRQEVTR